MKVHAPKVKSRVVACWVGASRVNSMYAWHSASVMSSNARKTLRRDPDGRNEHVHCSATAPRKCIETGCVVEQRPTDGLKRLQEPNSRDPQITGTTPSDAEKMGALQNSAKTVMACTATAKNLCTKGFKCGKTRWCNKWQTAIVASRTVAASGRATKVTARVLRVTGVV